MAPTRARDPVRINPAGLAATLLAALATADAGAQSGMRGGTQVPEPQARRIAGVITDTAGRPLEGASVLIGSRGRQDVTNAEGVFHFTWVWGDSVTVVARRIGFYPQSRRVAVGREGASLIMQLVPHVTSLPAVVTEAAVTGLSGVVSDTSLVPLADASVQALGAAGPIVRTDSGGAFFIDAKPGQYMVRVTRKGHQDQMVSVTIPKNGGRRIAVRLTPGEDARHARQAEYADRLRSRLLNRSAAWSRLFTRENILAMNISDVVALASIGAVQRVNEECSVSIDGGMDKMPLWAVDPNEIEMMEVYARTPITGMAQKAPAGNTSISGMAPIRTQSRDRVARMPSMGRPGECPSGGIYVWTRK